MKFFSKEPRRRLFFAFVYVIWAVWFIINDFAWLNILVSILMVFGGYIAVVKSKIIKDKKVDAIDDYRFDTSSIFIIVCLLVDMILY